MIQDPLPTRAGVGLKAKHYDTILATEPDIGWFEIHPENYMGAGGSPHAYLTAIREGYALSFHGVGLSLGAAQALNQAHLAALKKLTDRYQPAQVSEHLSWSHWNSVYLNDLLPLPYHAQSLQLVCDHVDQVQDYLGRAILVENPSVYLTLAGSTMSETQFFSELTGHTGCGLLLDINNVYVSATNNGTNAYSYIDETRLDAVGEIHLAGHSKTEIDGLTLCIDDHGSKVIDEVWSLYQYCLARMKKPAPVLLEWDTNIPDWQTLYDQAQTAESFLQAGSAPDTSPRAVR